MLKMTMMLKWHYLEVSVEVEDEVLMAFWGKLAKVVVLTAPSIYGKCVAPDWNGNKVLYFKLTKVLYRLLQGMLLFYHKLWGDLHCQRFIRNLYDPCVANCQVNATR